MGVQEKQSQKGMGVQEKQSMVNGAIFDMDGLMYDTERLWDTFWPPVCERLGLNAPPADFYTNVRGLTGEALLRRVEEYYPGWNARRLIEETWQTAARVFSRPVPCKPGLFELLEWLRQHKVLCAVASSSPRAMVQRNLDNTDATPYFRVIIGGEDVHHSKPDPEAFLLAAQKLGVPIRDCLILEDSHNGVRAGHASGGKTVMVPDLMPVTQEMRSLYDACCQSLLEVRDRLQAGTLLEGELRQ